MTDEATRIAHAEQAESALQQFLRPAFVVIRADYLEKLASIAAKPLTNDMRAAMEKLALGVKVVDEVRGQIESLVADGVAARADRSAADNLASLPAEKRRWATF